MDVSALKNTPLFADVPDEALTKVATFASLESVAEGKTIIREGGYSNDFYVIEDGTVKVEREGEHLADLGPGDVFGEQGLLEKQERSATVTATSPVRADPDRALGALADEAGDARGRRRSCARRSSGALLRRGAGRRRAPRLDSRLHMTVGGQGKSGAKPARSRHCDRASTASHDASQPLRRESGLGKARRPARKPGDLPPAEPIRSLEGRVAPMTTRICFSASARSLRDCSLLASRAAVGDRCRPSSASLTPDRVDGPGHDLHRRRGRHRADATRRRLLRRPRRLRRRVHLREAQRRSACWRPPAGRPRRSRRSRSPTSSGSGSASAAIGGVEASMGESFWYFKVNHSEATVGADQLEIKPGDEVLFYLAPDDFPNPNPAELELVAPARARPATPFSVSVLEHACVTQSSPPFATECTSGPAAGVTISGGDAPRPPAPDGTAQLAVGGARRGAADRLAGHRHPLRDARDLRRDGARGLPGDAAARGSSAARRATDQGHRRDRTRSARAAATTRSTSARAAPTRVNCGEGARQGAGQAQRRRRPKIKGSCERIKRK